MTFRDRFQAAKLLASKLAEFKNSKDLVVLALPRGGVPLGYVLAKELNLPLEIFLNREIVSLLNIPHSYIENRVKEILQNIKAKREIYNIKSQDIKNKRVILVDDGIATGSTALLAIKSLKDMGAKEVIVATPVAPKDSIDLLSSIASKVIVLIIPTNFMSVGAYYQDFHQLDDKEVINLLNQ